MRGLFEQRLIVVIGKGGVGKSTVAAALGAAAARSGRRTIVAEVAGRTDVPRILGVQGPPSAPDGREHALGPGLHHVSIDERRALSEYLHEHLPIGIVATLLQRSDLFTLFTAATPGMRELLSIGKVWELTREGAGGRPAYDLVVLDAPATANGLALLAAPRTFAALAGAGPVARQGEAIRATLCDPARTAIVVVATPEEMAVSEAVGLRRDLRRELGRDVDRALANAMFPARFSADDATQLRASGLDDPAIWSARWLLARGRAQRAQRARLRRGFAGVPCASLPFLFGAGPGPADVERLSLLVERPR
jgi:anion-transporting  ArsA/GET3 family ATPase